MSFRDSLESLSNDQLRVIIDHLSDKIGREAEDIIFEDLKRFSAVDPEEIVYRVCSRFRYMDDQIAMESNVFGEEPDKLYLHDKAARTVAELMVDEFLDDASLLEELGMTEELDLMIQSVANGLRKCHNENESTIVRLSGDAPLKLAEKMDSCIGTDSRMSAFGKNVTQ